MTKRRRSLAGALALVGGGAIALTAVVAVFADGGNLDVQVADSTGYAFDTTTDGAIVEYIGKDNSDFGSSGTGVINSFLQTQDTPSEEGYNTDGTRQFDTGSSPTFNRAIFISEIPVVACEALDPDIIDAAETGLCWELFSDINDSNAKDPSAAQIQLTELEIWLTANDELTGYVQAGDAGFPTGATEVYDFEGIVSIRDVNSGSGRGDMRYLVPLDGIDLATLAPDCDYGSTACATYFVVYTEWGDPADGAYRSDSGFEEWTVKRYPFLDVTKTVTTAFTRTYAWTIDKSVDQTSVTIADGGTATFDYEVEVGHDAGTDSAWAVSGTITIDNPSDQDAVIASVTDVLSDFGSTDVVCGVTFPYTLPEGDTLICTYSESLGAGTDQTNTAQVTLDSGAVFSDSADVTFGDPTTVVDECIDVTDDYAGTLGTVCVGDDNPTTFTYSRTESGVAGTCTDYDNTASFVTNDTGAIDDDDVTVEVCVGLDLTVAKDATPTYTRTYAWTIDKSVDETSVEINNGDSYTFNYEVEVGHDAGTDSGWTLDGTITISNPNDWQTIVADVTDAVDNGGSCSIVAGGDDADGLDVNVPASGSATVDYQCTYASAPIPADGTNTATATWDAATYHTPTGTASGTADADFSGDPTTMIDECIDVSDTYAQFLGTVCVGGANPTTFSYSRTITPGDYATCGTYTYDNTASFVTNDTEATDDDDVTVEVEVEGCGNIFHTGTTCRQYLGLDPPSGLAGTQLNAVEYSVKSGLIKQVNPGVFFYYNDVTAIGGSITLDVNQDPPGTYNYPMAVFQGQVLVYDENCSTYSNFTATDLNGDVHLVINGTTAGHDYIFSVKYTPGNLVALAPPGTSPVTYDWETAFNGISGQDSLDFVIKPGASSTSTLSTTSSTATLTPTTTTTTTADTTSDAGELATVETSHGRSADHPLPQGIGNGNGKDKDKDK